jgi:mono/diheme cytochrome c family protein
MRLVNFSLALLFIGVTAASAAAQDAKAAGEKLFAANKCSICHSIDGKGNAKGSLDGVGSKYSAEEIRQWLINPQEMTGKTKATRKPPMPPFAKLSKPDLDTLVTYLSTLKKK